MLPINQNEIATIIVANWKMNPTSNQLAVDLFNAYIKQINFSNIHTIVAPPAVYLEALKNIIVKEHMTDQIFLSAQNICAEHSGAYTGEISGRMLKYSGCNYTIIGHSERRNYYKEDDVIVARKFIAAIKSGLIPIVCVGEEQKQYSKGEIQVLKVLDQQIDTILNYAASYIELENLSFYIAYEPIWSIGTGIVPDTVYISNICNHIQSKMRVLIKDYGKVKVLYGGSVNKDNCRSILKAPGINGVLVGGASLSIDNFKEICNSIYIRK